MNMKVSFIILLVLGVSWACDSREVRTTNVFTRATGSQDSVSKVKSPFSDREAHNVDVGKRENLCTLCEEYTSEALEYIAANKTQTEIVDILHKSCSKLHSLKQECITLVDYYAPLFFLEISSVEPAEFCSKFGLCEQAALISQRLKTDSCEFCQNMVSEVLLKLEDPDTQFDILEVLLKGCKEVKGHEKQCKKLVLEYGPIILANAEHLLESNDICAMLHACKSSEAIPREATIGVATS